MKSRKPKSRLKLSIFWRYNARKKSFKISKPQRRFFQFKNVQNGKYSTSERRWMSEYNHMLSIKRIKTSFDYNPLKKGIQKALSYKPQYARWRAKSFPSHRIGHEIFSISNNTAKYTRARARQGVQSSNTTKNYHFIKLHGWELRKEKRKGKKFEGKNCQGKTERQREILAVWRGIFTACLFALSLPRLLWCTHTYLSTYSQSCRVSWYFRKVRGPIHSASSRAFSRIIHFAHFCCLLFGPFYFAGLAKTTDWVVYAKLQPDGGIFGCWFIAFICLSLSLSLSLSLLVEYRIHKIIQYRKYRNSYRINKL